MSFADLDSDTLQACVSFAPARERCAPLQNTTAQREHRRLSYSGSNLLMSCPRKYQLTKAVHPTKESTIHTAFGSAFGAGVQAYLVTGSTDRALVAAAAAWDVGLWDFDKPSNKSLASCFLWLEKWVFEYGTRLREEYTVFLVNGRPAVELAGHFEFPDGFTYRMFVDAVLQDKDTGELLVLEVKTRGSVTDPVEYHMSDQGTGYAVLVDALATRYNLPASFAVAYMVLESKDGMCAYFPFVKSTEDRLLWIANQLATAEIISNIYGKMEVWPTRGNACKTYGRTCPFAGSCTKSYMIADDFGTYLPAPEHYDFKCTIESATEVQLNILTGENKWLRNAREM